MSRRTAELGSEPAESTAQQLATRDAHDLKVVDFMNAAEGVTTLDSTELDFEQTVQALISIVRAAPSA
jgi:cytidylate kinase